MAKDIQIPGYEVVIPNSVWSRETRELSDQRESPAAKSLIRMGRYSLPIAEVVVEAATNLAFQYKSGSKDKSNLHALLSSIDSKFINAIADNNAEVKRLVLIQANKYFPQMIEPYKSGLRFTSGIVPIETIDSSNPNNGSLSYHDLISKSGNKMVDFKLLINRSRLPSKSLINLLLSDMTRISGSLCVNKCDDNEKLNYGVDLIFSAVNSPEDYEGLEDITNEELRETAARTILKAFELSSGYNQSSYTQDSRLPEGISPISL